MADSRSTPLSLLAVVLSLTAPSVALGDTVPFDDPRWSFEAEESAVGEHLGRQALFLRGGRAWLPDVEIRDGVVEFDIAFGPERGFSGGMFRFQEAGEYEHFYLRPHMSGMPDASQYTPVVHGVSGWQLLHGPEYGAPFAYRFDEWIPVRIVFRGDDLAITVDGETFHARARRDLEAGSVGVNSGFAPAHFSNFRYASTAPETLPAATFPAPEPREEPAGLVKRWRVSNALPTEKRPALVLDPALRAGLEWRDVTVEPEGFVDLAGSPGVDRDHRVVLAELTLPASPEPRVLQFGYSDAARVFVDGKEVYRGSNAYQTRDYRYLGTIGLFDAVIVPAKDGDTVVTFAVAESFGGWGVMAAIASD